MARQLRSLPDVCDHRAECHRCLLLSGVRVCVGRHAAKDVNNGFADRGVVRAQYSRAASELIAIRALHANAIFPSGLGWVWHFPLAALGRSMCMAFGRTILSRWRCSRNIYIFGVRVTGQAGDDLSPRLLAYMQWYLLPVVSRRGNAWDTSRNEFERCGSFGLGSSCQHRGCSYLSATLIKRPPPGRTRRPPCKAHLHHSRAATAAQARLRIPIEFPLSQTVTPFQTVTPLASDSHSVGLRSAAGVKS